MTDTLPPRATPITSEDQWHALRAANIGSSEVAALFDASPYMTRFMLYHAKAGNAPLKQPDDERVDWGQYLEPGIARGIAAEMRWNLVERKEYLSSATVAGLGCTIDRHVEDHLSGPGIVEIKNVDFVRWKMTWTATRAPPLTARDVRYAMCVEAI